MHHPRYLESEGSECKVWCSRASKVSYSSLQWQFMIFSIGSFLCTCSRSATSFEVYGTKDHWWLSGKRSKAESFPEISILHCGLFRVLWGCCFIDKWSTSFEVYRTKDHWCLSGKRSFTELFPEIRILRWRLFRLLWGVLVHWQVIRFSCLNPIFVHLWSWLTAIFLDFLSA